MKVSIQKIIQENIALKTALLKDEVLMQHIETIITFLSTKISCNQQLFICGNGGSAADALHLAAEFSGRFYLNRKALPVEALNVNMAAITAISNDFGFEEVYARMLESKAKAGDVLWVLSTSGSSPNIIRAAEKAKELGVDVIAFTGEKQTALDALSKFKVKIPSETTPRIQECHLLLGHIICEWVEKNLFPNGNTTS